MTIYSDFPNEIEKDLFEQISNSRSKPHIHVSPFPRFGFSGAKLFLIYFNHVPTGLPFIIKMAKLDSISREFNGVLALKSFVPDCVYVENTIFEKDGWGALLYHHLGTSSHRGALEIKTLKNVLFCRDDIASPSDLHDILNVVFDKLSNAHSEFEIRNVNIKTTYDVYLRRDSSQERIKRFFGSNASTERFYLLKGRIFNPLLFLQNLPENDNLPIATIHGDLHPDNIVLYSKHPSLIDFAWANGSRDVYVDYVLLENSIRFWHFPRPINCEDQLQVDKVLLDERGWEKIETLNFSDVETKRYFIRVAEIVKTIRSNARAILGSDFSMRKYLLSQFIVLYGLLNFDNYDFYVGVRNLGLIASRVKHLWGF